MNEIISFGWTRLRAAPMTALLLKTFGLLAATLLALRLLAPG
ncbi:hypothetical protein [Paracraurococcus ruber]|nr:hypothetical protein [Paracraurococcus ruber]